MLLSTHAERLSAEQSAAGTEVYGDILLSHRFVFRPEGEWTSLLVQAFQSRGSMEPFETPPSQDQLVVVIPKGCGDVESFSGGFWRRAKYQPGSVGMTPSGQTNRLRVRPQGIEALQTLHVHIPTYFFAVAAEEYRRAGSPARNLPLNALSFLDPVVSRVALSLRDAAKVGAPDLYAESATQFLATHLLSTQCGWTNLSQDQRKPGTLGKRRLARVIEYMNAHYNESLTVDQLAQEAGVSRFHFARLFKEGVGVSPYRYLVRIRMDTAASLLSSTDLSVMEIALACGYQSAAHFTAAFQRHFFKPPSLYR